MRRAAGQAHSSTGNQDVWGLGGQVKDVGSNS